MVGRTAPVGSRLETVVIPLRLIPIKPHRRKDMKKIDIAKLPELKTGVGIHGSSKQSEVGGSGCAGVIIIVITG